MEGHATEKQQENIQKINITENSLLVAIGELDNKSQGILLKHFKLGELFQMVAAEKDIARCVENYSIMATFYIDLMNALIKLRTESIKVLYGKNEEDAVKAIEAVYDGMSDVKKKEFCRKLVDRNDFFQDAFTEIMEKMNVALSEQKEKVCSKNPIAKEDR